MKKLKAGSRRTRNWTIDVLFKSRSRPFSAAWVRKLAKEVLKELEKKDKPRALPERLSEVAILFLNDNSMRQLNKKHRGKDRPTDVLSFALLEGPGNVLAQSLGDVVISLDTARRQARRFECSLKQESGRLLIHGLLHLFGYDHEGVTKKEVRIMEKLETQLHARLL